MYIYEFWNWISLTIGRNSMVLNTVYINYFKFQSRPCFWACSIRRFDPHAFGGNIIKYYYGFSICFCWSVRQTLFVGLNCCLLVSTLMNEFLGQKKQDCIRLFVRPFYVHSLPIYDHSSYPTPLATFGWTLLYLQTNFLATLHTFDWLHINSNNQIGIGICTKLLFSLYMIIEYDNLLTRGI